MKSAHTNAFEVKINVPEKVKIFTMKVSKDNTLLN